MFNTGITSSARSKRGRAYVKQRAARLRSLSDAVRHQVSKALVNATTLAYHVNASPYHEVVIIVAVDPYIHNAPQSAESSSATDADLMRAVARKDRRAFETLYYAYAPRLGRYLSRVLKRHDLVDEVVNDVMLVVWESAPRYDPSLSRLSTWMFGIAHNKALKALARMSRHQAEISVEPDFLDDGVDAADSDDAATRVDPHNPEQTLMGRQLGRALQWAVESLSAEHRAVVELAYAEDCSYQEIADVLSCPVNTVKTRMFYARKHLAELLATHGLPA